MPIQTLVPPAPAPQQQMVKASRQVASPQGDTNSFSREMAQATKEDRPLPEKAASEKAASEKAASEKAASEKVASEKAAPENTEPTPVEEPEKDTPEDIAYAQSVLASAAAAVQADPVDAPDDAQILAMAQDVAEGTEILPVALDPDAPMPVDDAAAELPRILEADGQTQNANILEGSVPTDGTDAREALPGDGAVVMDDPESQELNAAARMPETNPKQAQAAPVQTSFLENADELSMRLEAEPEEPPMRRAENVQVEAALQERDAAISRPVVSAQEDTAAQAKNGDASAEDMQPPVNAAAQPIVEVSFAPESRPVEDIAPPQPFEQIALEATLNQGVGRNRFVMRLQPETLGEVTVRLVLASDGVIARISVSNENARAVLSEQLYQLGDSMRDKGIDVRSIELVQDYTGQSAMLHDGNRGSADQNPTPRWKQTRYHNQAEAAAAVEGYDQTLIAQITVGETQTITFDA